MLELKQIEAFFPEHLRQFKKNMLREYLQYKVLGIIYNSPYASKLSFMGGTAIHILHSNIRFSEDLDFDNIGLDRDSFNKLTGIVQKQLQREGYSVELTTTFKRAYRAYIKIKYIMHESGVSGHRDEKLLIMLDTEPQDFVYKPDKTVINKFDVLVRINAVPVDVLLSQKLFAILMRNRPMGRDFYDALFLFGMTAPNYDYLRQKADIRNTAGLKKRILARCKTIDFGKIRRDVEPFLYQPEDAKKILIFKDFIKSI